MLKGFSHFAFSKVADLEYSSELAEIARKNMQTLGLSCKVFTNVPQSLTDMMATTIFIFLTRFPRPLWKDLRGN